MRILHVVPSIASSYGGPVYALLGYLAASSIVGIETEVCAPAPSGDELAGFEARATGVPVHVFPTFGKAAFIVSPALQRWISRELDRFDVVHVHGLLNPVSTLAARICRRRGHPYVLHPFGTLSRYTFQHRRKWLKRAYFTACEAKNLRCAGGVHFTTAIEQAEAKWHGFDWSGRQHVIAPPWFPEGKQGPERDHRPSTTPEVVLMARLDPVKRIELLIDAWPAVAAEYEGARLVIAGSGSPAYEGLLRDRAARSEASGSIHFAGFVSGQRKAALLTNASAFVLPSYHENFGIAVIEALAAGLPVVVTPEVQLADFVASNGFGLVAEPTPDGLAAAISIVLRDETMQIRCADLAADRVSDQFGLPRAAQSLREMYRDVQRSYLASPACPGTRRSR